MTEETVIQRVGVVGLGNMGAEIAVRLAESWTVVGFDLDPARSGAVTERVTLQIAGSLSDLGDVDAVLLSLPTREASHAVVADLCETMPSGAVLIETSTINPSDAQAMAQRAEQAGLAFADVAVLSGVAQMRAGQGALMAGGSPATVTRVTPLLDALTHEWSRVGEVGSAMALKVIHNAVIHAVMVSLVEGAAMARAVGADVAHLGKILTDLDRGLMRPLTHRYLERMLAGDYEGGMPVDAARKDSTLVLELAQQAGVPLFSILSSHTVYDLAVADGLGRLDYAAIAKLWEGWLGLDFSQ